jgi:cellulase-like Ig domain-containing protein
LKTGSRGGAAAQRNSLSFVAPLRRCGRVFLFTGVASAQLYIRLNQVGFKPYDYKSAIVFSREPLPSAFRIVNSISTRFFTGNIKPLTGSWGQFGYYGEVVFTGLEREDQYLIQVGSARSTPNDTHCWRDESWMGEAGHYQYYPFMNIGHFRL